jgi:hypothetical protein
MFLHEMDNFAKRKNFTRTTEITFNTLFEAGEWAPINEQSTKFKVIQLWSKYKKVTAIAASVGGFIAGITTVMLMYFSPSLNGSQVLQLSKAIEIIKNNQKVQGHLLNEVKTKLPENAKLISGGWGDNAHRVNFMIKDVEDVDGKIKLFIKVLKAGKMIDRKMIPDSNFRDNPELLDGIMNTIKQDVIRTYPNYLTDNNTELELID